MGLIKRGKVWYIRYRYGGKDVRQAVGLSKRKAELALGKIRAEIAEGRFLDPLKSGKVTYRNLLERYLKDHSAVHKTPHGYRDDTYMSKKLLRAFGHLLLKDITPDRVTAFIEAEKSRGLKPASINRLLALLKHSFTMAKRWGLILHSCVSEVRLLPERNRRLRYLEPEEYKRLLKELPDYLRPIVITAANTGMRRGEILSLKWEQVNLGQRILTLTNTKNGEIRGIPLNSTMVDLLRSLMRERAKRGSASPYVFTNPLTGDRWKDLGRTFEAAVRKARIQDFTFHDLRHTAASWLVMSGVDLLTVASILGHKDIRMTQRYSHLSPQHRLKAMEDLGQALTAEDIPAARFDVAQNMAQDEQTPLSDDSQHTEKIGATRRSRTGDLLITNQLLCRLS